MQQVKTPSHHHDRAGGAAASRSFSSVVVDRTGRAGPLILLGMHRSGTSMAARLLERLGVFMGWRKDSNHEADFFRHANEWLLSQAGGAWDHPEPVRTLLAHGAGRALAAEHLRLLMSSPRALSYTGARLGMRPLRPPRGAWGWKDPRNTYTLPLWIDIFPDAKVLHMRRHGVDVAWSLVRRSRKSLESRTRAYRSRKPLYVLRPRRGGFVESYRCATLDGALDLWLEYTREGRRQAASLCERAVDVQYEDLLERPVETLRSIVERLGLPEGRMTVEEATAMIRPERAFAYRHDDDLRAFAARRRADLEAGGYEP